MSTRDQRSGPGASRSYNRYPSAPDGRRATSVPPRAKPVGKDPLAVDEGKNDTAAQMEFLAAKRGV
jgi:hypothetical protein